MVSISLVAINCAGYFVVEYHLLLVALLVTSSVFVLLRDQTGTRPSRRVTSLSFSSRTPPWPPTTRRSSPSSRRCHQKQSLRKKDETAEKVLNEDRRAKSLIRICTALAKQKAAYPTGLGFGFGASIAVTLHRSLDRYREIFRAYSLHALISGNSLSRDMP